MKYLLALVLVWNSFLSYFLYRAEQENFILYENQRTAAIWILADEQKLGTLKTNLTSEHTRERKLESLVVNIAKFIVSLPNGDTPRSDSAPNLNNNGY